MSISGDSIIMRNGRSTSQVSIYNYPEHLNPFYEEDQHKRLRFWHINKKNDNERWKSISITSLKDLWPLKSFRLSKKKSSTLGINKTSESPPLLRRDDYTFGSPGNRTSLQNVYASKRAASMGFERNDQYRSTIQVMGANQTLPHQKRYIYTRSFTPQPQRSNFMETPTLTRRSGSRTSTTSTNPFEESEDDEYDDSTSCSGQYFGRGHMQTQSLTPAQRKQKRRAPIPAALINKVNKNNDNNNNNESSKTSHEQTELRIEEDEDLSISNLSSQIQSFVDTSLSKDNQVTSTPIKCNGKTPTPCSTPKIVIEHVTISNDDAKDEKEVKVAEKDASLPTDNKALNETKNEKLIIEHETKVQLKQQESQQQKQVEPEIAHKPRFTEEEVSKVPSVLVINEDKRSSSSSTETVTVKTPFILTTPPTPEVREKHEKTIELNLEQPELREIAVLGHLTGPEKPKRSSLTKRTVQFIEMEQQASQDNSLLKQIKARDNDNQNNGTELNENNDKELNVKITQNANEEKEDILKIEEPVELRNTITTIATNEPLKIVESLEIIDVTGNRQESFTSVESTGAIPRTPRDWTNSTLAPLPMSVPLEKRKSAKEIIESINRQQRLLKEAAERNLPETRNSINQRLTGVITYNYYAQTATNSNDNNNNNEVNYKIPNNLDKNIRRGKLENGHYYGEHDNDIDIKNGEHEHKLENGSPVFAKCRVYKENYPQRESSPTTSNLDWNPLPKPKRNKDINLD